MAFLISVLKAMFETKPMTSTHTTRITKINRGTVDVDEQGNIIRITDASGRVVYCEAGA